MQETELRHGRSAAGASFILLIYSGVLCLLAATLTYVFNGTLNVFFVSTGLWSLISVLVWHGLKSYPHDRFGAANCVTTFRAMATALLAGLIPVAENFHALANPGGWWFICLFATVIFLLDGLDGYLARKSGLLSDFGARYDMEVDALLGLVLAAILWQSGKLGMWILALGLMRYCFFLAGFRISALQGPLYPSLRRKTVCCIQVFALCVLFSPLIQSPLSTVLGAGAIVCLAASFAWDIHWLVSQSKINFEKQKITT
jgi:phosphatidylglycerophosphate synthase